MPRASAAGEGTGRLGLAAIVRAHGEALRRSHRLAAVQHRALEAIAACRTPALGGHLERCDRCGATRAVYHSCRNRHCPQCQALAQTRWVEARRAELLPIPYFHVVFTLPHALNALAQHCPRLVYTLLFQCATDTLQTFGRDPRHLGGELGITAILHTWGQSLTQHLHLHCVVTGGALASDGSRWIPTRHRFLFPVRALSQVFRGKDLAALDQARARGALPADVDTSPVLRALRGTPWVVYAKPPFGGPEKVLAYLGRYTHRIALSNERILAPHEGVVHSAGATTPIATARKVMLLSAEELLRRFLLHVVPTRLPTHPPLRPARQPPSRPSPLPLPRAPPRSTASRTSAARDPGRDRPPLDRPRPPPMPRVPRGHPTPRRPARSRRIRARDPRHLMTARLPSRAPTVRLVRVYGPCPPTLLTLPALATHTPVHPAARCARDRPSPLDLDSPACLHTRLR
jgi:hypothetical protein